MDDAHRVGVLLSGRGSNFLALHEAMGPGEVPARVAVVVSNVAEAPGLEKARSRGIPAFAEPRAAHSSVAAQEEAMASRLREHGAEWVCLAGYMRILGPDFVRAFRGRILNIHPSLLPSFPGLHAQRQALAHGVKISGCTVHFVDESLDGGPIVVQRAVPVYDRDSEHDLAERILTEEHRAYPEALRRLLVEGWRIEGRRVVFGS
jgi:phosphoribosylglycinamide formyltransferase-1